MKTIEYNVRQCIHVGLLSETHKNLRKVLLEKEISIQAVFQKFAELVVLGDKRAEKIVDEIINEKKEKQIKRAKFVYEGKITTDSLYDLIGDDLNKQDKDGDEDDENFE